jgi:hypothetical protein
VTKQTFSAKSFKMADELSKYRQMLKVGLPEGAVRNAMNRDGVDPSLLFDASAAAPSAPKPKSKPIPTSTAAASLPPHPLHGIGGGGNDKSALHDQIKAMAANRNRRVEREGPPALPEKPKPKKSIDAVLPPVSKPAGMATASIADQVAMMAARRNQRMQEEVDETPLHPAQTDSITNISTPSAPSQPVVTTMVTRTPPPPVTHTPLTTKKIEKVENQKVGFFGGSKKAAKENPAPAPTSPPQEPFIIKTYKPEPIPAEQAKPPVFTQARLKSTGLRDDLPKEKEEQKEAPLPQPETNEALKAGTTTTTITTVTTTKTKRVVKSDPEYDVTEYKVGCFCTVM